MGKLLPLWLVKTSRPTDHVVVKHQGDAEKQGHRNSNNWVLQETAGWVEKHSLRLSMPLGVWSNGS